VSICYENNLNRAEIGAVTLTKELYGPAYAYDEKNNVKSVTTLINEKSSMEYDEFDNLISYIQEVYAEYTIPAPRTELTEDPTTRKLTYEYDGLGRLSRRRVYADGSGASSPVLMMRCVYERRVL